MGKERSFESSMVVNHDRNSCNWICIYFGEREKFNYSRKKLFISLSPSFSSLCRTHIILVYFLLSFVRFSVFLFLHFYLVLRLSNGTQLISVFSPTMLPFTKYAEIINYIAVGTETAYLHNQQLVV